MRKHLLLGTTALLAGAVAMPDYASAEDPLRLQVRGYKNEYFALGNVDDQPGTDFGSTSHFSDGEIHFKGDTTLDNGLTIGVQIELEATQNGDQIDEAYTNVSGGFGKLVIGSENLSPYLTFWGVTAPNVGVPINSGWISVWVPNEPNLGLNFRSPGRTTNVTMMNDTFGISYQSPRFAGVQFTAGYSPSSESANNGGGDPGNAVTNKTTENHDIIEVGLNVKESVGGVDIGLAAGYGRSSVNDTADAAGSDDPQQVKAGINIGVTGFSVGGSYANELEGNTNATNTNSQEGQSWDIGASYSVGPWGVSAIWFHGEEEHTIADPDDDEVDAFVGAVSYALGPGIKSSFSVIYSENEDEGGSSTDGTMGIIGLSISF